MIMRKVDLLLFMIRALKGKKDFIPMQKKLIEEYNECIYRDKQATKIINRRLMKNAGVKNSIKR